MNILGMHGHLKREDEDLGGGFALHDAAAVLLRDGVLVAAVEEERLSRLKHANTFPFRAISRCLEIGGISIDQVDCIAVNRAENYSDQLQRFEWLRSGTSATYTARGALSEAFHRAFATGDVSGKVLFCPHHLAHAWSAWAPSGFEESLVYVADGAGDRLSGMVLLMNGTQPPTILREYSLPKSLGDLYALVIGLIGYGRFDEYKAMGLAPYGDPTIYEPLFSNWCQLLPDGDYELSQESAWVADMHRAGLLSIARRRGQPFTQQHKDIAAGLQSLVQRIVMHVVSHYAKQTGARQLCLAGGVCQNCSINGTILYSGLFDRVFVQPAAYDAGGAYGAAIHAAVEHGQPLRERTWRDVYFGTDIGNGDGLHRQVERWRDLVDVEVLGGSVDVPAQLMAEGQVIGWVQGRSEFGPRALGNRSILADPRPAENKGRINAMVKKREAYRPFAPAVLVERVSEYFDVPPGIEPDFPFMIFVLKVRPAWRERLGAITHVDGTARVQTVSRDANPRFWQLIRAFEERTGVGVLLNTSFNNDAEPIVDSPDDAIACYLTTGLDAVVIGDYLLRRKSAQIADEVMQRMVPRLHGFRRVVKREQVDPATQVFGRVHAVQTTRSRYFGPPDTVVSEPVYRLLQHADGRRTIGELTEPAKICECELSDVCAELRQLWRGRVVSLAPPAL
jgi:carbamoyltransferase